MRILQMKTRMNLLHKSFLLLTFLQFAVMETGLAQSSTENENRISWEGELYSGVLAVVLVSEKVKMKMHS
jgi:hypothetical protein